MSNQKANFLDNFFPNLPVMTRFWLIGLIIGAVMGVLVWVTGAPEAVVSNSDYMTTAADYFLLWGVYLILMVGIFLVFKSENFDVKTDSGEGSSKYKTGVIWGGILAILITVVTIAYTVLSIKHA